MKKRFITVLLAIVMVTTLMVVFTGCDSTETITSTKTEVGSYSIFQTEDVQEYLSFLENFDESKYEIVDISTSINFSGYGDTYYMVTYKKIAE